MNFSKSSKLHKILSLILVITLVGTMFSGCLKKNEPTEPSETPGLNLNTDPTDPPTETTLPPTTEPEEVNENMGTITQPMNLRSTPSTDGVMVTELEVGERVEIIRRESVAGYEWGLVDDDTHGRGWVMMDYVEMDVPTGGTGSTGTPAETTPPATQPSGGTSTSIKGVISGNGVNIRDSASVNGNRVGGYNKGDVVTILETKNGWGRTDKGWVSMDYVNTSSTGNTNTNTNNNNNNTNTNTNTGNGTISGNGKTDVIAKGIVNTANLNLRPSPSTEGDRLGALKYGDRVNILEKSGSWGRTSKGWISLNYVYMDGTNGSKRGTGTITGSNLYIRSGPGTDYASVGSYSEGDTVTILEQFTYGNATWGCTNKGWISMAYVDMDDTDYDDDDGHRTGVVTADGGLRIRAGAGTGYEVVGTLAKGDKVIIFSTKTVGGITWGEMEDGWISMNYVDITGSSDDDDDDDLWSDNISTGSSNGKRTGVVTADGGLRIRSGAGTGYEVVGTLRKGDTVTILATTTSGGITWGQISEGWISMAYVDTSGSSSSSGGLWVD